MEPSDISLSSNLHRRNSIPISTQNGIFPPPLDFELVSFKSITSSLSYISLKDHIPGAAINSPTGASSSSTVYKISIHNRLVKQAAWAYLLPIGSSSPDSSPNFFRSLCIRFSAQSALSSCFSFVNHDLIPYLTRLINRIIRLFRVRVDR